jgi:cystathionine beta-lyase
MSFDFDTVHQRLGTDSQKWQKYPGRDILPLWVADMDFKSPPAVIEAITARAQQGIFGYARPLPSTTEAVLEYFIRRYAWRIDPSWIVWLPGLVVGLNVTAQAFAVPGEEVLCLTPVYPPFMTAPQNSGRIARTVPLLLNRSMNHWEIDWDALEQAVGPNTRLFYLCNPHNPVARVFLRGELEKIGEFCCRHDLVLCSDEIHCDLILDDLPHIPSSMISPEISNRTVTLMAPSKTYNVPGMGTSIAIIPDAKLRARFARAATGIVAEVNCLGYCACEAAFRHGEAWRQDLLGYLRGNRDFLLEYLSREMPLVQVEAPIQATYLAWLNVSRLGLKDPVAHFEERGVGLSEGQYFGSKRGDYLRLNFGCPRSTLREALRRMKG